MAAQAGANPSYLHAVEASAPVQQPIFHGKLRAPDPPAHAVRRPRLHQAIDAALAEGVVIVTAPAGSGKTVLLSTWTAEQQEPPLEVAWVTLGRTERDPVGFLSHVVAALHSTAAGAEAMEPRRGGPALSTLDDGLASVARAMSRLKHDVVLVLDDFHHVVGSETEVLLARVMRYPADLVHLVVLGREEPDLGQTRLRLLGRLQEIGPADLALTPEEIAELFARHDVQLGGDEAVELYRQTGGWVTAVHTLATSAARIEAGTRSREESVGSRIVAEYLHQEVLGPQPPEVQQFLLQAATADPVCGALADALTGRTGSGRTLADLHRRRLFLERDERLSDERCSWYRWHPMFLTLLRTRQYDEDPVLAARLHLTASDWLRRHGFPVQAVQHALAADDSTTAAAILGECWVDLVVDGRSREVRSLLSGFDEEQVGHVPELALVGAYVGALHRDLQHAQALARHAVVGAEGLPPRRRVAVELMSAVIRLRVATLTGRVDDPELYPSALSLLEETSARHGVTRSERRRRVLLLFHLGAFEVSQWRYDAAADHLDEAVVEAATLQMPQLALRARAQLAALELATGRLDLVRVAAQDVIDDAASDGWHGDHGIVSAHLALGAVHLRQHDLDAALRSLSTARTLVRPADQVNRFRIGVLTTFALLQGGQLPVAERELEELRHQASHWMGPSWVPLLLATVEASWLHATGQPEAALRRLEAISVHASEPHHNTIWRVYYAGLLLNTGRPAEARLLVEPIVAVGAGRLPDLAALVVDAVAAADLGLRDESMLSLAQAVRHSARGRVAEPFVAYASRLRPLLAGLLERGTAHESWVSELLEHLSEATVQAPPEPPVEPLTAREVEVLRAMSHGATNKEIAGRLFISVNTLRTHQKHIHRKLATTSRREAAARARALGLL